MKRSTVSVGTQEEVEQNEDNEHKRRRVSCDEDECKPSSLALDKEGTNGAYPVCIDDPSDGQTGNSIPPELSSASPPDDSNLENSFCFESVSCSPNVVSLNCSNTSSYNSSYSFPEECPLCLPVEDQPPENPNTIAPVQKHLSANEAGSTTNSKPTAENMTTSLLRVKILEGHSDSILCISADESTIVSASADTTVKVWDMTECKETCSLRGHTSVVTCVILFTAEQTKPLAKKLSLKETSRIVVSGSIDCTLRLWSLPKGEPISSVYTFNGITCLQYLHHECCAIIGTDGGKLELWDLCCSALLYSVRGHEDSVSDIHDDGYNVCTASKDGTVKVWEVQKHSLHLLYSRKRKEVSDSTDDLVPCQWNAVRSLEGFVYLGDNSANLKILDWKAGKLKIQQSQTQNPGITDALCLYDNVLVSSSFDFRKKTGAIHVWQLPEMRYICSMSGPVERIYSLSVTYTEDRMLRIVSAGTQLMVWDYDFSQPCLGKCDNSFYCHILEPLAMGHFCDKRKTSFDVKTRPVSFPMNIIERSWWCNVI